MYCSSAPAVSARLPAYYLAAAAGVGTLGIVDDDVVDRSNLQRQILHTDARVGKLQGRLGASETL